MTIALTAVTGSAQVGLTSPTYTPTLDVCPVINGKQYAITALGGTQTGVEAHSVAAPFTVTVKRPVQLKTLGPVNTQNQLRAVPRNNYEILVRKGVIPLAGQPYAVAIVRATIEIPAGADVADPESIRAMLSCAIGALTQISSGLGDTVINGVL